MKMSLLALIAITILMAGCAKETPDISAARCVTMEEYKPGVAKEIVTTKSNIKVAKVDSVYVLEGDMLLSEEQVQLLEKPDSRGAFINDVKYTWPRGIVYFYYTTSGNKAFTQFDKMSQAINQYHQKTGVEFRPVTYVNGEIAQADYIRFVDSDGNWSFVGRKGGVQELGLHPLESTVGSAIHELGHSVALMHEHSRRDRDNYVNVIYSNILPEWRHAYDIEQRPQNKYSDFDFNSIMLYPPYNGFAIDESKPTMTKKDGSTWTPQKSNLSPYDVRIINWRYVNPPCKKHLREI